MRSDPSRQGRDYRPVGREAEGLRAVSTAFALGDRVRVTTTRTRRPGVWEGYEGTVIGPWNDSFTYAVRVRWDKPGPPEHHVIEGYLTKVSDAVDEIAEFFV